MSEWNPTKEDRAFAKALDYWSKKKNFNRPKLAELCGKSVRTIDYVFSLQRGMGKSTAFTLAAKLGTNYADMLSLGQWILDGKEPGAWVKPKIPLYLLGLEEQIDEIDEHIDMLQWELEKLPEVEPDIPEGWLDKIPSELSEEEQERVFDLLDTPRARLGVQLLELMTRRKILAMGEKWQTAIEDKSLSISDFKKLRNNINSKAEHILSSIKKPPPAFGENMSNKAVPPSEFIAVPKYTAKLSGGPGSFETSDQIDANLMFKRKFLERKGQIDKMALFEVTGESMQPFIYHGDVVLVDMSVSTPEQIVDGKAYAFREDQTVKIKRLSRQGGTIIASSENHMMYLPYHVDLEEFQIIGRVIWVGHEVN